MASALSRAPRPCDVALAATVHALALHVFYNGERGDDHLQITAKDAPLDQFEAQRRTNSSKPHGSIGPRNLPGEPAVLLAWCLAHGGDTLRGLLTFCAAQTVNAVLRKADRPDSERMA